MSRIQRKQGEYKGWERCGRRGGTAPVAPLHPQGIPTLHRAPGPLTQVVRNVMRP